jgi:hypothetical protein
MSTSDGRFLKYGPDGKTPQVFYDGAGNYMFYDRNGQPQTSGSITDFADCQLTDTGCGQCSKADKLIREAMQDCFKSNGKGALCGSYQGVASCCGTSMAGDPRVVMPTPDGGLMCNVDSDTIKKQECKKKCSVASDPDCEKTCTSSKVRTVPFDAMDRYCQAAISEDCFSSGTIITVPDRQPGAVNPRPYAGGSLSSPFADVCVSVTCRL